MSEMTAKTPESNPIVSGEVAPFDVESSSPFVDGVALTSLGVALIGWLAYSTLLQPSLLALGLVGIVASLLLIDWGLTIAGVFSGSWKGSLRASTEGLTGPLRLPSAYGRRGSSYYLRSGLFRVRRGGIERPNFVRWSRVKLVFRWTTSRRYPVRVRVRTRSTWGDYFSFGNLYMYLGRENALRLQRLAMAGGAQVLVLGPHEADPAVVGRGSLHSG